MAEIIDDTESFTIALTEAGEPDPDPEKKIPWLLIGAAIVLFWLLARG